MKFLSSELCPCRKCSEQRELIPQYLHPVQLQHSNKLPYASSFMLLSDFLRLSNLNLPMLQMPKKCSRLAKLDPAPVLQKHCLSKTAGKT